MIGRGLLFCLLAGSFSVAAYAASTTHDVDQKKLQFNVSELRIKKGDVVRFMNSDRPAHNILVNDGASVLSSGLQQPGQPYTVPFPKTGTFPVTCGIHSKMHMTVIVE